MAEKSSKWQEIGKLSVKTKPDGKKYFAGSIVGKNGKSVKICIIKKNADYLLYKKNA